jgi:hypothetical protein
LVVGTHFTLRDYAISCFRVLDYFKRNFNEK